MFFGLKKKSKQSKELYIALVIFWGLLAFKVNGSVLKTLPSRNSEIIPRVPKVFTQEVCL